jgi:hypothetical protein
MSWIDEGTRDNGEDYFLGKLLVMNMFKKPYMGSPLVIIDQFPFFSMCYSEWHPIPLSNRYSLNGIITGFPNSTLKSKIITQSKASYWFQRYCRTFELRNRV